MSKKYISFGLLFIIGLIMMLYLSALFDSTMRNEPMTSYSFLSTILFVASSQRAWKLFLLLVVALLLVLIVLIVTDSKEYQSKQMVITSDISTPVKAGQGQCGTAEWLPKEEYDMVFGNSIIDSSTELMEVISKSSLDDIKLELKRITEVEQEIAILEDELEQAKKEQQEKFDLIEEKLELKQHELRNVNKIVQEEHNLEVHDYINNLLKKEEYRTLFPKEAGVVFGKRDLGSTKERIYYLREDVHTLILGATRSGKGRTVLFQTIAMLALAGESIVITDPKAESYYYFKRFLEILGYDVLTIDYKNPKKSTRYNYLQQINDFVDSDDIPGAIDATWDLVSQLVGEPKGERLWTDGEASMIAACIMAVVYDNRDAVNHKYRNLTNVYYFLSQMCTPVQVGNVMVLPLSAYVQDLSFDHPSKGLLAVSDIAPSRTRGSFYTSALMTLRLFTNPLIADMTSKTDFNPNKITSRKTALFIILPEDRRTYYDLATLFVAQLYQISSKVADARGGRLPRRLNMLCDEYGNFAKITNFTAMQTVGGGKGIRYVLFVQDFNQIDDVYEKTAGAIIRSNCENWIYLQTDDPDTLKGISEKLGKYTISTYSLTANHQKFNNPSSSHNISLTGRDLLTPDEVAKIKRPYTLVTSRNNPAIFYAPDLSQWFFNSMLGLGDKEHNRKVRLARENIRPQRFVSEKMELWGIWDKYKNAMIKQQQEKEEKAMREMAEHIMNGQL